MNTLNDNEISRTAHHGVNRTCPSCKNPSPDSVSDDVVLGPFTRFYANKKYHGSQIDRFNVYSCGLCGAVFSTFTAHQDKAAA